MRLSICIPTYNRASILMESINSIARCMVFQRRSDIEIVVVDNASTDETAAVIERASESLGGRLRYFRNTETIHPSLNVEVALRKGQGDLLKLANDSLVWNDDGLNYILNIADSFKDVRPGVFFLNGTKSLPTPEVIARNGDEFLDAVSFQMTWIGGFCIWRERLNQIDSFSQAHDTSLTQVDIVCRQLRAGEAFVISALKIFDQLDVGRKGGYDLVDVFGVKYLKILQSYPDVFSQSSIQKEKRELLCKHILPWYYDINHDFCRVNSKELLDHLYRGESYYEEAIQSHRIWSNQSGASAKIWRMRNTHNETMLFPQGEVDIDTISVGKRTYGPINVRGWGHPAESLSIGHYTSIAEDSTFVLGGNHEYTSFSTFPFKVKTLGQPREAESKGPIRVGSDVWIGTRAMILSGVTIGQGAIVGAGAVVASDVPPYAIVVGNPARVVKFRFPDSIIEKLLTIDYDKIDESRLAEHAKDTLGPVDEVNIESILDLIRI